MKISHIMSKSKILTDLCAIRHSAKLKNTFANTMYNVFLVTEFWQNIGRLKINGKHTAKLRSDAIKFKNHFKQLAVPFKIYADFECNVKGVRSSDRSDNNSYTEKYQANIPCRFTYKAVLYRGQNVVYRFI